MNQTSDKKKKWSWLRTLGANIWASTLIWAGPSIGMWICKPDMSQTSVLQANTAWAVMYLLVSWGALRIVKTAIANRERIRLEWEQRTNELYARQLAPVIMRVDPALQWEIINKLPGGVFLDTVQELVRLEKEE